MCVTLLNGVNVYPSLGAPLGALGSDDDRFSFKIDERTLFLVNNKPNHFLKKKSLRTVHEEI